MQKILAALSNFVLDVMETMVISMSVVVIVYFFAFQPQEVSGHSMDGIDNFHDGQYVLADKISYRFKEPVRGDVIIFKSPVRNENYIKRIIGLPNESISISDNKVYIYNSENPDGVILDESAYIAPDVYTNTRNFMAEGEKVEIPEGYYFVMGDNRPNSSDSRQWGLVPRDNIKGRSAFRYWPANQMGVIQNPPTNLSN